MSPPSAFFGSMPSLLRPIIAATITCTAFLSVWGCQDRPTDDSPDPAQGSQQPMVVVCTTTMIGDIVRTVAGDTAEIHVLFGTTVDPHLFRATRDDVQQLMAADLVFYNGFGLEGYLVPTLHRVAKSGIDIVAVAEAVVDEDEAMRDIGVPDPHVWMDPRLWSRTAPLVAEALGRELPPGSAAADQIASRATETEARILALDAYARETIATIPEAARTLVTAHDAFRYFGRRYGMRVEGIQGLSTASEGGLQALETLVTLLVDTRIPAVFFESTVSERNVKALIEGAAARGHSVALGGTLHSDAPGSAGNYEAMMRHNIDTITSALRADLSGADLAQPDPREVLK